MEVGVDVGGDVASEPCMGVGVLSHRRRGRRGRVRGRGVAWRYCTRHRGGSLLAICTVYAVSYIPLMRVERGVAAVAETDERGWNAISHPGVERSR